MWPPPRSTCQSSTHSGVATRPGRDRSRPADGAEEERRHLQRVGREGAKVRAIRRMETLELWRRNRFWGRTVATAAAGCDEVGEFHSGH